MFKRLLDHQIGKYEKALAEANRIHQDLEGLRARGIDTGAMEKELQETLTLIHTQMENLKRARGG